MKGSLAAFLIAAAVLALCGAGCRTPGPRYRLVLSNAGETAVSNVTVRSSAGVHGHADLLPAGSDGADERLDGADEFGTVAWTTMSGETVSEKVRLKPPMAERFRGRVYIQIEEPPHARVFFVPDLGPRGNELPWNERQTWEGAPSIPGFDQQ